MDTLIDRLNSIEGYKYQIWHYDLSHSILTLRGTTENKSHHNIHISFADVQYFQFPFSWTGDLYPARDNESIEILLRVGVGRIDQTVSMEYMKERFSLYKADSPYTTIYILGRLFKIDDDVEPLYK